MKQLLIGAVVVAVMALAGNAAHAQFPYHADVRAMRFAETQPWHGSYYYTAAGYPVPLVVPPTSNMQVKWGWGVAQSESVPIYHRFRRAYPGTVVEMNGGAGFYGTPRWPSHTDQFGVYYIRGPW